jgi:Domain of Unknown Function (DUF928)
MPTLTPCPARLPRNFSIALTISLLSFLSLPATAQQMGPPLPPIAKKWRYVPKVKRPLPRRTEAGGIRGCDARNTAVEVDLLIPPDDSIPQTPASHPTFRWEVSNPLRVKVPMQFSLIEPGQTQPIYQQDLLNQGERVMQLQLPAQMPGLTIGKPYRWMVSFACDAQNPDEKIYFRNWIERN